MSEGEGISRAREALILFGVIHKVGFQAIVQHLATHGGGISPLQLGMMKMLSQDRLTLSELSRKFQLDPSTLVPSIDGLEQRGYVVRGRDPNDRRRLPLELTEQGDAFVRAIPHHPKSDPLEAALNTIGVEKTDQLLALLYEVIHHIPDAEANLKEIQERMSLHRCEPQDT